MYVYITLHIWNQTAMLYVEQMGRGRQSSGLPYNLPFFGLELLATMQMETIFWAILTKYFAYESFYS